VSAHLNPALHILLQVQAALAGRASPEWRLADEKQREAHAAAQGATSHLSMPPLRYFTLASSSHNRLPGRAFG
jgi:hypothetical protein